MALHDKTEPKLLANIDSEQLPGDEQVMWHLVAEISQRLQISFASIKAAISSLLGGDIFWDQATQHEFMQTIDKSVDDISGLTAVMTLAMRVKSNTLTFNPEPHSLQEIISQAKDLVQRQQPNVVINLALPTETRPVIVDFEQLRMALRLLLEVLLTTESRIPAPISLQLTEELNERYIIISGEFTDLHHEIVYWLSHHATEREPLPASLRAEIRLKIIVAYYLLTRQAITITPSHTKAENQSLVLSIPFATEI